MLAIQRRPLGLVVVKTGGQPVGRELVDGGGELAAEVFQSSTPFVPPGAEASTSSRQPITWLSSMAWAMVSPGVNDWMWLCVE